MTTAFGARAAAPCTALGLILALSACGQEALSPPPAPAAETPPAPATTPAESPGDFLARGNSELSAAGKETSTASWVSATYITEDTNLLSSLANARQGKLINELIADSRAYDDADVDATTRRDLSLLRRADYMPCLLYTSPSPRDS